MLSFYLRFLTFIFSIVWIPVLKLKTGETGLIYTETAMSSLGLVCGHLGPNF